jgi:hypothetical protein
MTRQELLACCYKFFRDDKQLPVTLYVKLQMNGIDPEKLYERWEEQRR